jgi:hypothetical protein
VDDDAPLHLSCHGAWGPVYLVVIVVMAERSLVTAAAAGGAVIWGRSSGHS